MSFYCSEKLVEEGVTDRISMCRPFIRELRLVARWKSDDTEKASSIPCDQCRTTGPTDPSGGYVNEPLQGDD
jgi:2,4-dienoyl-CoA reductase-like NADH-dependent reductase (Old Yellow Enzyme family)